MGLLVSERKIFPIISNYKSVGANDPRGLINLDQGHGWQDLCKRPLNIATYLICKFSLMVSEKKVLEGFLAII